MFATETEFKLPLGIYLLSDEDDMSDGDVEKKDEMDEDGSDGLDEPDGLDKALDEQEDGNEVEE